MTLLALVVLALAVAGVVITATGADKFSKHAVHVLGLFQGGSIAVAAFVLASI